MNTIKKVFIFSAILILVISSVMTASKVRAASEFTCGTTSLNDNPSWPGTINCETGTDYIRWTFSGLPGQSIRFGYNFSASQPAVAEMRTQVQYAKRICDGSNPSWSTNWYIRARYYDASSNGVLDFGSALRYFSRLDFNLPCGSNIPGNDDTTRLLTNLIPGTGKSIGITREDGEASFMPPAHRTDGMIEIKLITNGQSSIDTSSPFYCSKGPTGGYYTNNPHEVDIAMAGAMYPKRSILPDGLACETGSNYIKWTFQNVSPELYMWYAYKAVLYGQAVHGTLHYRRSGFAGGAADRPCCRTFGMGSSLGPSWDWITYPIAGITSYSKDVEWDGVVPASADAVVNYFTVDAGDNLNIAVTDYVDGYFMIVAPNYVPPTPTATATLIATATGTPTLTLTPTATGTTTLTSTVTLAPTSDTGGGGGGGDSGGGGGGSNPTTTSVPTWTHTPTYTPTPTRTSTSTATSTATATATRTSTPGATASSTSTPVTSGSTATPTLIVTGPASTPDYPATLTAISGTLASVLTATPTSQPTSTPIPIVITESPTSVFTSGTTLGTPSSPFSSGAISGAGAAASSAATPVALSNLSIAYSGPCTAYLRVLAYIDTNTDNIMALNGEGIEGIWVNLVDADYNVVEVTAIRNGVAKFCVPESLAGQSVVVDIPYLLRSGSVQVPRPQTQSQGSNPFGNSNSTVSVQTLELFFKLDAPTLPLSLP